MIYIYIFKYYEDGYEKKISFRKVYRMFHVLVDKQGTNFISWLLEMEHMQILIRY